MRGIGAGFGLVAFLIAIAISLWMWGTYTAEVAKYGVPAEKEARQFAGQDENGRRAMSSMQLVAEEQRGRVQYMLVDAINPQGGMGKWFHLQQNDQIIAACGLNFRSMEYDAGMAEALIERAYQTKQELVVMRGGKKISLPEGTVLDDGSSFGNSVTVAPTTQPAKAAGDERVVPKELGPLRGIIR
ncbi:MAG TPA: hypothetical protein VGP94_11125 [Tepidisphaeraceae bacterium]|jgi:hypothetical protein|nr:hypothetical protein [Tepidisphaeraceae bacterium]